MTTLEVILVVTNVEHSIQMPHRHLDFVQNLHKEQHRLLVLRVDQDQLMEGALEPVGFGQGPRQAVYLATCLATETSI